MIAMGDGRCEMRQCAVVHLTASPSRCDTAWNYLMNFHLIRIKSGDQDAASVCICWRRQPKENFLALRCVVSLVVIIRSAGEYPRPKAQGPRGSQSYRMEQGVPKAGGWALPEIWSVGSSARSRDLSLPQSSLLFLHARLRLRVDFHFILANNSPDRYSGIIRD